MLLIVYYTERSKKAASQVARWWLSSKTTGSSNLSLITNIINPLPRKILLPIFFCNIATKILEDFFTRFTNPSAKYTTSALPIKISIGGSRLFGVNKKPVFGKDTENLGRT